MGTIRAFLFDMDGLLIDTESLHMRAFAETAARFGYVRDPKEFVRWIGYSAQTMSQWLTQEVPEPATPEKIVAIEKEVYLRILTEERPAPLPGAKEMIAQCDELGVRRGLVSSTIFEQVEPTMEVVLAHLGRALPLEDHFQPVVTGDRVQRRKPDPEPYQKAARLLDVETPSCLVFEDSPAGVAAAREAGCRVVAIPNMYLNKEEVIEKAHAHFPTLAEAHQARVWETL